MSGTNLVGGYSAAAAQAYSPGAFDEGGSVSTVFHHAQEIFDDIIGKPIDLVWNMGVATTYATKATFKDVLPGASQQELVDLFSGSQKAEWAHMAELWAAGEKDQLKTSMLQFAASNDEIVHEVAQWAGVDLPHTEKQPEMSLAGRAFDKGFSIFIVAVALLLFALCDGPHQGALDRKLNR